MNPFPLIAILVSLAAIASYVNCRIFKLPTTIGVMLIALLASLALILIGPYVAGLRQDAATLVSQVDFNHFVFHGVLAFLLFAAAIHLDLGELRDEWLAVALLAIFGTLASTFLVGGATWLFLGWMGLGIPFLHALLFGALISPTDPIAVLGIMRSVGAPRQLEVQVTGESLFNDGLGVVVFLVLLQLATPGEAAAGSGAAGPLSSELGALGLLLLVKVGGALVLALGLGFITYKMLKGVDSYQVEVLLTLALAMGVYALADALDLSAPIAVVVAGLVVGNQGRAFAMSEKTRENVDTFWELVDEILNVMLFLLIGLELLVLPIERGWLLAGAVAIPVVLAARSLSVAGIIGPSAGSKRSRRARLWSSVSGARTPFLKAISADAIVAG